MANKVNKLNFKVKNEDGKELMLAVVRPSRDDETSARIIANAALRQGINNNVLLRAEIDKIVKDRGIWDDKKEAEKKKATQEIKDMERRLLGGGLKKSEGKALALSIIEKRNELLKMDSKVRELSNKTAEARSDDEYFNAIVSFCTVYADTGHKVFESYEDYLEKADTKVAESAATNLMKLLFSGMNDARRNLPEYRFLLKYKYVNDDLNFIDEKGRPVDKEGRLIDENDRYINEAGEFVDESGLRVDEDGNYVDELADFQDD